MNKEEITKRWKIRVFRVNS